jgi:threonine dehydrogenase-like Zn-dependent dehydrogenase
VIEAVGTQESMMQAIRSTRPGGHVGYVGVAHDVALPGEELLFSHVHLHGGPAPVRRFLPELIDLIWNRTIDPGKVFDLSLPSTRPPRATAPWTSAVPSRRCCSPDRRRNSNLDEEQI